MSATTYRHYPSFTRRFTRSIVKLSGLPKKHEKRVFLDLVEDPRTMTSINGEALVLEHWHEREGRIVVPELSLSQWLQEVSLSKVSGEAFAWPYAFSTISLPTDQTFAGCPIEGVSVSWVNPISMQSRYDRFLQAYNVDFRMQVSSSDAERWLIVSIHNPLDKQTSLNPSLLRAAFTPVQLTDFINREAMHHVGLHGVSLNTEEQRILNSVLRYVVSLGMYLSAYPDALSSGVPAYMKNKHPGSKGGVPFAQVNYDRSDSELIAAMRSPHTVSPYWRQLRDERFYRGKWKHHRRGSRYVLVSGYEVGGSKAMAVESADS